MRRSQECPNEAWGPKGFNACPSLPQIACARIPAPKFHVAAGAQLFADQWALFNLTNARTTPDCTRMRAHPRLVKHLGSQGLAYSLALQCKCGDAPGRQEPATPIHPRTYLIRPLGPTGPSGIIPTQYQVQSSSCQVESPSASPKDQRTSWFSPKIQCPTEGSNHVCPQRCENHLRSGQLLRLLQQHRQHLSKIMTTRRPRATNTQKPAGPSKGTSLRIFGRRRLRQSHPTPIKSPQRRKRSTLLFPSHVCSVDAEAAHTSTKQCNAP
jgi:hypothetical protein